MSATVRHMPLVTQLRQNTSVITKEIMHFRTIVHTFVFQIRENIENVLSTLLKGTRKIKSEFEVSIMDDVIQRRRHPKTARLARPKTRTELHKELEQFSGIEQEDNSRVLDSLLLESPAHSHKAVGVPRRMARRLSKSRSLSSIPEAHELGASAESPLMPNSTLSRVVELFDSIDVDSSGDLTLHEWRQAFAGSADMHLLKKVFDKMDQNGDQKVSVEEFKQAIQAEGLLPSEDQVKILHHRLAKSIRRRANVHFASADLNLSGDLCFDEFQQAFGNEFERHELQLLFNSLDTSRDGRVSLAEFRDGMSAVTDGSYAGADISIDSTAIMSATSFKLHADSGKAHSQKKRDNLLHTTSASDVIKRINQRCARASV